MLVDSTYLLPERLNLVLKIVHGDLFDWFQLPQLLHIKGLPLRVVKQFRIDMSQLDVVPDASLDLVGERVDLLRTTLSASS